MFGKMGTKFKVLIISNDALEPFRL